jgi:hypothetical protein
MPDGSFKEGAFEVERGPAHALVASLVRQRQAGRLNPADAVSMVRASRMEAAFPNIAQWETAGEWWLAQAGTSAEVVVKFAGAGHEASKV